MKVETIDRNYPRDATCRLCHRDATVFAVKLSNGAWTSACEACAGNAESMRLMERPLTKRQRSVLEAIAQLTLERGVPPTVREIGTSLGLTSPATVEKHIIALIRKGYVANVPGLPRTLRIVQHIDAESAA